MHKLQSSVVVVVVSCSILTATGDLIVPMNVVQEIRIARNIRKIIGHIDRQSKRRFRVDIVSTPGGESLLGSLDIYGCCIIILLECQALVSNYVCASLGGLSNVFDRLTAAASHCCRQGCGFGYFSNFYIMSQVVFDLDLHSSCD